MKITKNPFFYLSIVLFFAVVFEVAGIVNGATINWTPPTQNPPFGNPAQPLDTSATSQNKAGGLTIIGTSGIYGTKITPGGFIQFGRSDGAGGINNSLSSDGAIGMFFSTSSNSYVMGYRNPNDTTWSSIGSGSIGTWPISIPTTGPQGTYGSFGFKLAPSGWTGFDLSGNAANRLILGVSNSQISNANNILDIEGPIDQNQWTHMMELRADGSAMFRGNVTLDNSSNKTTNVSGFWYNGTQPTNPGGTYLGQAVCTTYPNGTVCQLQNGQYKNGDIGYIQRASWGYFCGTRDSELCAIYRYSLYTYGTKPETLNNVNTATVKAGAFMDNNGPVGPSGSWCGMGFGDWHIKCDGMDVISQGCPAGYTQATFGKASNAGDWANDLVTCFKN